MRLEARLAQAQRLCNDMVALYPSLTVWMERDVALVLVVPGNDAGRAWFTIGGKLVPILVHVGSA